jgi:spore coat polysaccharide biosynthesis protein SpsF (cytidylyltransferase family)
MAWHYFENVENLISMTLPEDGISNQNLRLTLDYEEDYWLLESVRRILGNFATRSEINDLFKRNPDMSKINLFRDAEWRAGQLTKKQS